MTAAAVFNDREHPTASQPAPASPSCEVVFSRVADARRIPDTIGVVAGRAVKSPADSDAWLRSVLKGLEARGLAVHFEPDGLAARVLVAQLDLKSAWLTDLKSAKASNVVIHVEAARAGGEPLSRDYRGSVSRINWASTDTELQHLIDDAFARALDDLAHDLKPMC